ncbi:MAG: hypothetical protein HY769_08870 [Candidatus Stahlbacteria bacterium]|nr:hypothetical protein [Candidatus Stahlbacteria bacterium]
MAIKKSSVSELWSVLFIFVAVMIGSHIYSTIKGTALFYSPVFYWVGICMIIYGTIKVSWLYQTKRITRKEICIRVAVLGVLIAFTIFLPHTDTEIEIREVLVNLAIMGPFIIIAEWAGQKVMLKLQQKKQST